MRVRFDIRRDLVPMPAHEAEQLAVEIAALIVSLVSSGAAENAAGEREDEVA